MPGDGQRFAKSKRNLIGAKAQERAVRGYPNSRATERANRAARREISGHPFMGPARLWGPRDRPGMMIGQHRQHRGQSKIAGALASRGEHPRSRP